ncbi:FAD binding domain-containing protein [Podospora didyma]|uniref:FAD binding domain-containing protein n=1 Tax=Podospora didyma TaxID=330526 RepID=A0AAE0P5Y3_9PEZI|nr:FAD binding domain-containing protein [Podospora didyma]
MVSKLARGASALFTLYIGLTTATHSSSSSSTANLAGRGEVSSVVSVGGSKFNGCAALEQAGLGDLLYYAGEDEYSGTILSYYSKDVQDVKPSCILKPKTAQDVAKAIKVLNTKEGRNWPVAIRSGGHAPYPSNNAKDGVTIDLARLDSVKYKSCKGGTADGRVSIGSGARWGNVYSTLEPLGVMVGGGREGHVGVGGFLLGGGFSWYSGKRGMCADDVVGYQIVLADGSIKRATAKKNPELFKALKGGLNNLGIVTRFDISSFPAKTLFGGITAFPWTVAEPVVEKFVTMIDNNHKNQAETGFISLSWSTGYPSPSVAFITANVDGVADSPSFRGLEALGPPVVDYRFPQPLSGLVSMLSTTLGSYNVWYTLSVHNTMDMARKIISVFDSLIAEVSSVIDEPSVQIIFVLTPLPKTYGQHGANILGLDKMAANSFVIQPEVILPSQKFQPLLQQKLKAAVAAIESYAKRTAQDTPWRYINYANPEQNPLASYGAENARFLSKVAKDVDPLGYFQGSGVSGAFKVSAVAGP